MAKKPAPTSEKARTAAPRIKEKAETALAKRGEAPTPVLANDQPIHFVYRVDGDNQLELDELMVVLNSLGEVIQDGNQVLFPNGPDVAISVTPFEAGSFDIQMLLSPAAIGPLMATVQSGGVEHIWTTLSNLGVIASKVRKGYATLMDVLKKFGDEPPKELKEIEKDVHYEVTAPDGQVLQINAPVKNLYYNPTIIKNLTAAYTEPLKRPRRKKVQSYVKEDKDSTIEVTPQEAPALETAKSLPLPGPVNEQHADNTNVVFLSPRRGSFEGEGGKWSFRKGGRQGEVVQANIKDTAFLDRLRSGEYRLSGGDVLKVELSEKQKVTGSDIHTTNEITKVLDYKAAPRQGLFDFDGRGGSER